MSRQKASRYESHRCPDSSLIDLSAAAELLGTSERHMRRLVAEGRIGYVKLGDGRSARLRFRVDRLAQWIDDHSFEPEGPA